MAQFLLNGDLLDDIDVSGSLVAPATIEVL